TRAAQHVRRRPEQTFQTHAPHPGCRRKVPPINCRPPGGGLRFGGHAEVVNGRGVVAAGAVPRATSRDRPRPAPVVAERPFTAGSTRPFYTDTRGSRSLVARPDGGAAASSCRETRRATPARHRRTGGIAQG